MKLQISGIENSIDFSNSINVLEIKDKTFFKTFLTEINDLIVNKVETDNIWLINQDGEKANLFEYAMIIFDIFNLDFNSKTILNKLYLELNRISSLEDKIEENYKNIIRNIIEYTVERVRELPFECDINKDIRFKDVLKLVGLRINTEEYYNLEDKIMFLIDIINEFKIAKILIIVNMKVYFSSEEVEEIYKYAIYKNVKLLVIENIPNDTKLQYEKKILIDNEFDDFLI